jgi:hypothetical protein
MHKAGVILAIAVMSTTGWGAATTMAARRPFPVLLRFTTLGHFFFAAPTITSISGSPTLISTDPDAASPVASVTVSFAVPKSSGKNMTATLAVSSAGSCAGLPVLASDVTVSCQSATGTTAISCSAPQLLTSGLPIATSTIIKGNGVQTFTVTVGYSFADSWAKKVGSCALPLTYTVSVQ